METTKRLTVLLIVTVLTAGPTQAAEQPQAKLSDTRTASCLVKVTCDPAVLPLSFETIDYLVHSSGVGGKTAREVLDVSPDQVQDLFTIEYIHEFTSNAPLKSSEGRSFGIGYDEMMMEPNSMSRRPTEQVPPTSSPGRVGSFRRTHKAPSTGRTITTTSDFPIDEQTYLFSLNIQLPGQVKPAAEELMDALLQNLRTALTGAFEEHTKKLRDQLNIADEESARAEADLGEKQDRLRAISGSRILDRNRILNDIEDIRNDIQKIKMDQALEQVTANATTKQIAETKAKMLDEIHNDGVDKDLLELLFLQEKNLKNVEKLSESGRASGADVAGAREKLTRARIEWAQRRDQLSKSAGGNLIESLNSQLANYSIEATQNQAKFSNLEQQLKEAEELLGKADDYELLSIKADIAKQNLQETILWHDRMSRQIRMIQPPAVLIIGGD